MINKKDIFDKYFTIADKSGISEAIVKYPGEINGNDFKIHNVSKCEIRILDYTERIICDNVEDCDNIMLGVCSSTALIRNCQRSSFTVASKELRLSGCNDVKVFVYVPEGTNGSITLDDCSNVEFHRFNAAYSGLTSHFSSAKIEIPADGKYSLKSLSIMDFSEGDKGNNAEKSYVIFDDDVESEDQVIIKEFPIPGSSGLPENPVSSLEKYIAVEPQSPPAPQNLTPELKSFLYPSTEETSATVTVKLEKEGTIPTASMASPPSAESNEVEKYKKWLAARNEKIAKDTQRKREEMKHKAEEDLERFYEQRTKEISIRVAKNSELEEQLQNQIAKDAETAKATKKDDKEVYKLVSEILKKDPNFQEEYESDPAKKRLVDLVLSSASRTA